MRSGTSFVLALAASAFACSVQAGVVTGSPVPTFMTTDNSRDIVLSTGSPVFTANLSTYASFSAQTHSILGAMSSPYPGWADVEHQDASSADGIHGDIALPYAMVGRGANGNYGHFIWKFVLPAGYETGPGAKIDASVYFRHDPNDGTQGSNALLGILDTLSVYSDFSGPSNYPPTVKKTAQDVFGGVGYHGYDTYTGAMSLDIPAGKTEFYVNFSDQASSARWALTAFSVTGNPVPVPEPLGASAIGAAMLVLRRRRHA